MNFVGIKSMVYKEFKPFMRLNNEDEFLEASKYSRNKEVQKLRKKLLEKREEEKRIIEQIEEDRKNLKELIKNENNKKYKL